MFKSRKPCGKPNVLIGVSGNGRYLTRLINQRRVKRLEAWMARERDREVERERGGIIGPVLCVKLGPLAALSSCLTPIQDTH